MHQRKFIGSELSELRRKKNGQTQQVQSFSFLLCTKNVPAINLNSLHIAIFQI